MAQLPPPPLLGRREGGSLARASQELRLAHPTISGQIHRLEEALGQPLFTRQGRRLVLTEIGRVAFRYADEIFSLGQEFLDTVKGRGPTATPAWWSGLRTSSRSPWCTGCWSRHSVSTNPCG